MLNTILRGLMRRSDTIGKVYVDNRTVDAVPPRTSTITTSLTVPAGTYVIIANNEWKISSEVFTALNLSSQDGLLAIERGDMSAGGGASVSTVASFNKETKITAYLYHSHAEPVGSWVKLQAIRIK